MGYLRKKIYLYVFGGSLRQTFYLTACINTLIDFCKALGDLIAYVHSNEGL